jgi:hypothetical protein
MMNIDFEVEEGILLDQMAKLMNKTIGVNAFHHRIPATVLDAIAVRLYGGLTANSGTSVQIQNGGAQLSGKFKDYPEAYKFRQRVFDLHNTGWRLVNSTIQAAILKDIGTMVSVDDSTENDSGSYIHVVMTLELRLCGEIRTIATDVDGEFILDGNGDITYE